MLKHNLNKKCILNYRASCIAREQESTLSGSTTVQYVKKVFPIFLVSSARISLLLL